MAGLTPVPGLENEALDPCVARFDPYRRAVVAGRAMQTEVIVLNHAAEARQAAVRLRVPPDWSATPTDAAVTVPADSSAAIDFVVHVPRGTRPGRVVVSADVSLGGDPPGDLAETLLDVLPA